ncbi:MAG: hypothetical protein SOZ52_05815 [Pyramidobacter sp.]|nr:hypothetical protein [Pyramidobacter sp.]
MNKISMPMETGVKIFEALRSFLSCMPLLILVVLLSVTVYFQRNMSAPAEVASFAPYHENDLPSSLAKPLSEYMSQRQRFAESGAFAFEAESNMPDGKSAITPPSVLVKGVLLDRKGKMAVVFVDATREYTTVKIGDNVAGELTVDDILPDGVYFSWAGRNYFVPISQSDRGKLR